MRSVLAVATRVPSAQQISFAFTLLVVFFLASPARATSVIPTTDRALYQGADVVVHGIVVSSTVEETLDGSPETVTVIEPIEVLKGGIPGQLILRQAGGTLPDGTFFKLWGRPEYVPGREVVVFAISRPEGDFQTAEMLLGKFEIWEDDKQRAVAVADLSRGHHEGVQVVERKPRSRRSSSTDLDSLDGPRDKARFLAFLRHGARPMDVSSEVSPIGLTPLMHEEYRELTPSWAPISSLWRYNNGASAGWTLDGAANITGGGSAEAQRALATWTNDPNSTINQYIGGANPIHLNALTSPCGWSTALPSTLGVVGCGGPRGGGSSHVWRNETYGTITGGEVWLRAYSTFNQLSSVVTESIILHELGHALGLGHSDQSASANDTCRGDEGAAIMRSSVQSRTSLGTDDIDAIRWLYGDGGKSCSAPPPAGVRQKTPTDFNGDRVSDVATFRSGAWMFPAIGTGTWTGQTSSSCIPVPGDYDGDGRTEFSLYCGGAWHFYNSNGSYKKGIWTGGVAGDLPVPADYNGDGRDDVVIHRRGAWIGFDYSSGGTAWSVWTGPGSANAIPTPVDHNGDGRADFSVYVGGAWHFYRSDGSYLKGIWTGGLSADIPVPGDYDGNGTEELVIFRNGAWLFFDFNTGANVRGVWTGAATFNGQPLQPAPLDYDGDGSVDFSVFTGGAWHFFHDNGSYRNGVWTGGVPADRPLSRRLRLAP